MRRLVLTSLLCCSLVACGEDENRLYGSFPLVYSLDFDPVQIIRVGDQVSVEYQRMSGQNIEAEVAKLIVIVGDLANLAGNEVDLTEKVGGLPRGTINAWN
jgi:hypothetical protein